MPKIAKAPIIDGTGAAIFVTLVSDLRYTASESLAQQGFWQITAIWMAWSNSVSVLDFRLLRVKPMWREIFKRTLNAKLRFRYNYITASAVQASHPSLCQCLVFFHAKASLSQQDQNTFEFWCSQACSSWKYIGNLTTWHSHLSLKGTKRHKKHMEKMKTTKTTCKGGAVSCKGKAPPQCPSSEATWAISWQHPQTHSDCPILGRFLASSDLQLRL